METVWRISTHSLLLVGFLLAPTLADAQLGRRLALPSSASTRTATLGRDLCAPLVAPPALDPLRDWAFDLSATTSMPVSIGVEAQLETPIGVFASLSAGHAPSAYLETVAAMLRGADVFGPGLDPLVQEAIGQGAWNVRLGVGVRLVEGLELSVGYTYLTASTALSPETIEAATGQRLRWPGMTEVPMSIDVHALHGRLGWRFVIEDHFVVRAAIGWTHSVSTSAHVEVPAAVRELPNDPATQIEDAVVEGFGRYGFTPEVLLSAGYRF